MAQQLGKLQTLTGGISTISKKLGPANSFAWGRSIDFRSDPAQQTTYPQTKKISGSIVTDLPMFADVAGDSLFFHGNTGNIYKVTTGDVVTKDYTVPDSSGNGIVFFSETNQVYIPTNTSITRRDMTTGNYFNNFLETSGGAATNTKALLLVAASSQSATRADTASLSITGDITLETYIKANSLPTGSNFMSFISKWDESGATRSYKFDLIATSNYFGNGQDSSLTISSNTTQAPIDSACTGTLGTKILNATNASFVAGQVVLIHQSQGTNTGQYERGTIQSYTAGTITLTDNLTGSYATGAQVLVIPQYTNVTINSGKVWAAKAWNGTVGGILVFLATGTLTINGTINADGCGYRGGSGEINPLEGAAGECQVIGSFQSYIPQGVGGGGGGGISGDGQAGLFATDTTDLTTMHFGGGGGGVSVGSGHDTNTGGTGGGIIFGNAPTITMGGSGLLTANGGNCFTSDNYSSSGAGAGGAILLKAQTATLGTNQITVTGGTVAISGVSHQVTGQNGAGGSHATQGGNATPANGGVGGTGRININYLTLVTGSANPTINEIQDNSLNSANGSALRFWVSNDGTATESYTQNISDPTTAYHLYSVSWHASASTAIFYQNGVALGTVTGSKTSINDNASIFGIGCSVNGAGAKANFYDGLIDDVRVWNAVRTPAQIAAYYSQILSGSEANLVAYYPFEGDVTDNQTSANNNLTNNNSATFSSTVAFKGVTTRGDEDVFANRTGQLYTLKMALSETATDKITFVPTKEPFKSLALDIDTIGTGNWTITVHDELNDVVATMTVTNAQLLTGIYEFKFSSTERIILNATYHIHVYSTVNDGKVVTSVASDLSSAYLKTYFQVLVSDIYHQSVQFQNFVCIANERYLATLQAGNIYNPCRLVFPSGYRIRSLAFWQQYIVIGMWFGNNITDSDTGKLFFWDGESDTYIDDLDVPQGGINAMIGTQGGLLISAGYKGAMLEYTGYPSSFRYTARTSAQLAFRLPNVAQGDTVEIAPGAMTMWNAMNRIGLSLNTNSSTIHQGIYTYGQYTDQDPMSVGFDYPLSIGDNMNNNVKIGCLFTRRSKLYAGFQNSNTFGIDVVDENAAPYPTGTLEYLITDLGSVAAKKLLLVFRVDFEPLLAGQSVSLKWKPNRASSWAPIVTQNNAGATDIRGPINDRIQEAQFALDWVNTTTPVTFTQHTLETEDGSDERQT